tara:strand:+ start:2621 stop:3979 length:1359 start_codon:yes stop_codon:yes gene_type:complete
MNKEEKKLSNYFSWITKSKIILIYFIFDFLSLTISFLLTNFIFREKIITLFEIIFLLIIWGSFSYVFGRYTRPYINNLSNSFVGKVFSIIVNSLIFFLIYYFILKIIYFNTYYHIFHKGKFVFSFLSLLISTFFLEFFKRKEIKKMRNNRLWGFYGNKEKFYYFSKLIKKNHPKENYEFKYITKNNALPSNYEGLILNHENDKEKLEEILDNTFYKNNINLYFLYDWFEIYLNRIPSDLLDLANFFKNFNRVKNNKIQIRLKRYGDIVFSIILLIITLPILIISGFLIWISDRGPIIYKQKRVGKNGKVFNIFKLRTMIINAEENGPKWVSKKDSRITFFGRILRKTRIDEVPQLICVINGDMSLIGPRPERPELEVKLKLEIKNYDLRHLIKPGLSGWAQVNANYAASVESVQLKHSYDLYYISNQSLWIDILILLKTIKVVFTGRGSEPN